MYQFTHILLHYSCHCLKGRHYDVHPTDEENKIRELESVAQSWEAGKKQDGDLVLTTPPAVQPPDLKNWVFVESVPAVSRSPPARNATLGVSECRDWFN